MLEEQIDKLCAFNGAKLLFVVIRIVLVPKGDMGKWEHGTSYPDISLLPELARLLETDVNELLSFDEVISDQELAVITTEAMEIMKNGRYGVCVRQDPGGADG